MRYPSECPVFEVVDGGGIIHNFPVGAIVTAVNIKHGCLGCYMADGSRDYGQYLASGSLRPLTRLAREMYAAIL